MNMMCTHSAHMQYHNNTCKTCLCTKYKLWLNWTSKSNLGVVTERMPFGMPSPGMAREGHGLGPVWARLGVEEYLRLAIWIVDPLGYGHVKVLIVPRLEPVPGHRNGIAEMISTKIIICMHRLHVSSYMLWWHLHNYYNNNYKGPFNTHDRWSRSFILSKELKPSHSRWWYRSRLYSAIHNLWDESCRKKTTPSAWSTELRSEDYVDM